MYKKEMMKNAQEEKEQKEFSMNAGRSSADGTEASRRLYYKGLSFAI